MINKNRYTDKQSKEESIDKLDNSSILLNIMKEEFPDDRYYAQNTLSLTHEKQLLAANKPLKDVINKDMPVATRNSKQVILSTTELDEYVNYDISKSYPTIDEDELDELIDEEWETFIDPEDDEEIVVEMQPPPTGLFLVNSEIDLTDIHDLYINHGPQTLDEDAQDVTSKVFCVFFINNGVAYAIPTYKTLEVMLVERGENYSSIKEATPDEIKEFDLLIDGDNDELEEDDIDISPYEEFIARSLFPRDADWNHSIRFRSGYSPKVPFLRDPGDYIKPDNMRNDDGRTNDIYVKEDPYDRYWDQVFQKQTYRERLREKYEGKMIIADWPAPDYISNQVTQGTSIGSDDSVLNLRMMINGHWKAVTSGAVMKLYAYLNGIDISEYEPGHGRYGPNGYIQLLINGGGCTVVQPAGKSDKINSVLQGKSDLKGSEPLWNAFPHIVDADDDGVKGLDYTEYKEYLDNFNNGGRPFDIPDLNPFEPRGSKKYYPEEQYLALIQQALEQEQIDAVKDLIWEIWPSVAAAVTNTKIQLDAVPLNLSNYVERELGKNGPLYKLWKSHSGNWKYIKKKTLGKDRIKTKRSAKNLFKVCKKTYRIRVNLNNKTENNIVERHKWMKSVNRDKFMAWMSSDAQTAVGITSVGAGVGIAASMGATAAAASAATAAVATEIAALNAMGIVVGNVLPMATVTGGAPSLIALASNPITVGVAALVGAALLVDWAVGETPSDRYILPPWRFMDDDWYLKACIYNEMDGTILGFTEASSAADTYVPDLTRSINSMYEIMYEIDAALLKADSVDEFKAIYTTLLSLKDMTSNLNNTGIFNDLLTLQSEIDKYVRQKLKAQYNAIQFLRKKVHKNIGRRKKFGLVWPKGPQSILNKYIPGLKFNNHIPKI